MCGAGILLFLVASGIVLSLIPIYLPDHGSTLNYVQAQTELFYMEYSTTVDDETVNYEPFITDVASATQQLNEQLGISPNTIIVENIELVQQSNSNGRRKRAVNYKMLLISRANYPRTCRFPACRRNFLVDIGQQYSNHSNIILQLQSVLDANQTIQFALEFINSTSVVPADFIVINQVSSVTTSQTTSNSYSSTTTQTPTNIQLVQTCIDQDTTKHPVIIDTDADIDDLWAILYLMNVPTVDILAITTVGDGYSSPFYSTSNILNFLGVVGCTDRLGVASGLSAPSLSTGWIIPNFILEGIDVYLTSCLNQSIDIFLQPSPFEAVELIVYTLKYSKIPVDILVLGPLTNIAAAIIRDRSIVSKIGTLYVSGGQFTPLADYSSLLPNPNLGSYPYSQNTNSSSDNVFADVLAVQRVDDSGIKSIVALPLSVQGQLPTNLSQIDMKLKQLNITLTPFIYALITSLAACTGQSESAIFWWDNSAAQLMVQLQNNITDGFCTTLQQVQSLYILSASADQLFGQGLIDFESARPNTKGLSNYTICAQTDSDVFLTEFLTKLASNQLYSCNQTYEERFDIKLQSCLSTYGFD